MIFKLPPDPANINREQQDKVNRMTSPVKSEWDYRYTEYTRNRYLYDGLIAGITSSMTADQVNATLSSKKQLEKDLAQNEFDLLKLLNEPFNASDFQRAVERAKTMMKQGAVIIRADNTSTKPYPKKERIKVL